MLSWSCSSGSHALPGALYAGPQAGKTNFCHFNVSFCCLKPQLRPSPLAHVERSWQLWMPQAGKNVLVSEEKKAGKKPQRVFRGNFVRFEPS